MCHFVLDFSVLLVLRLPRLGKRELILVLFVRLFGLCLFRFVGFLFLLGSGKGCSLLLWHSLDFSLTFLDLSKQHRKGLCTKAVNSYWTKSLVAVIKAKKSLCSLSTHSLRVGLPCLIWRDIEAAGQVFTGTYSLQANRYIFSNKIVDLTCLHCQLEDEDIHHGICRFVCVKVLRPSQPNWVCRARFI